MFMDSVRFKTASFPFLFPLLLLLNGPAYAESNAHTPLSKPNLSKQATPLCHNLDALHWLKGQWRAEQKRAIVTESWEMAPSATISPTASPITSQKSFPTSPKAWHGNGETRSLPENRLISKERMLIQKRSNGELVYNVWLNQATTPVSFLLTQCSPHSATFNNPEHDFPNQLHYRQLNESTIQAKVTDNSGEGFTLTFHRVAASE